MRRDEIRVGEIYRYFDGSPHALVFLAGPEKIVKAVQRTSDNQVKYALDGGAEVSRDEMLGYAAVILNTLESSDDELQKLASFKLESMLSASGDAAHVAMYRPNGSAWFEYRVINRSDMRRVFADWPEFLAKERADIVLTEARKNALAATEAELEKVRERLGKRIADLAGLGITAEINTVTIGQEPTLRLTENETIKLLKMLDAEVSV